MRFTVYVVDDDGRPIKGKRVHVLFTSFFRGWLEEFTDDEGHAVFDYDNVAPGEATITVSDETHGPYSVDDGDSFTIQV